MSLLGLQNPASVGEYRGLWGPCGVEWGWSGEGRCLRLVHQPRGTQSPGSWRPLAGVDVSSASSYIAMGPACPVSWGHHVGCGCMLWQRLNGLRAGGNCRFTLSVGRVRRGPQPGGLEGTEDQVAGLGRYLLFNPSCPKRPLAPFPLPAGSGS